MGRLDRYIARQFLTNTLLLFVIILAMVFVVDFALNFDEYTRSAAKDADGSLLRQGWISLSLVADLWWPRFFVLYNYLLGIVMVGAMGFTLSMMVRHRELVATLSGGISLHRLAMPLVVVALLLTVGQALNRELLVPRLAPLLTRDKQDAGKHVMAPGKEGWRLGPTTDASGRRWYARSYDPDKQELRDLYVYERDANGLALRRIMASRATWSAGRWRLEGGTAQSLAAGDRAAPERVDSIETDLDATTMTLRQHEGYAQHLSTLELTRLANNYRSKGAAQRGIEELDRIRFGRVSAMACNLLALLVCMPFFLRRTPSNMLVQSVYCAPVAIVAAVGSTLGSTAAIPGLPPAVSALVPVMVLIPLAIVGFSSVRT